MRGTPSLANSGTRVDTFCKPNAGSGGACQAVFCEDGLTEKILGSVNHSNNFFQYKNGKGKISIKYL